MGNRKRAPMPSILEAMSCIVSKETQDPKGPCTYMSYSLNSLKGVTEGIIQGTTIGGIEVSIYL